MKQLLLLALMLPVVLGLYGQADPEPHRDTNQNCVLKIDYLFYSASDGKYVSLTNKQDCNVTILVHYNHSLTQFFEVPANTTLTAVLPGPLDSASKIWAKNITTCEHPGCFDSYWVQTHVSSEQGGPLGIKFKSVKATRIDDTHIKVVFDVEDIFAKGYYNIKTSEDGLHWKLVTVVFPDDTRAGNTYSVTIKTNQP